jgi:hypothetical protein
VNKLFLIVHIYGRTFSFLPHSYFSLFLKIFATAGDKSQGGTHVLYDPTLSEKGALVCVARAPRKKSVDDFEAKPVIHNPHALPLFRDQPSRKRQREKQLKDPMKSHKPELPVTGPGFGGRVGTSAGSLLTQYLLKVMCYPSVTLLFLFFFFFFLLIFHTPKMRLVEESYTSSIAARGYDKGDMDG